MSTGLIVAMIIAGYCTMFIMTYLCLYVYDYKRDMGDYSSIKDRGWFMEWQKNSRIVFSLIWFVFIPAVIGMNIANIASYLFTNFFNILDTIGSKITK